MRVSRCLLVAALLLNCAPAFADWRDDNPNKPNGYEASMLRYHYGTPGGDEPANGYAASEIRCRNGLDCYLPPGEGGPSGWGGGGGGDDSGRWGADGSIMKMHFRHGMQEGQSYWNQRMQGRLNSSHQIRPNFNQGQGGFNQSQGGFGGNSFAQGQGGSFQNGMNGASRVGMNGVGQGGNYGRNPATGYGASSYGFGGTPYGASFQNGGGPFHSVQSNQYPAMSHLQHINLNNPQGNFQNYANSSGNHQYAPSNGTYYNHYGNSTALQTAVTQRPLATMLRNSRGGFNQIYAP